MNPLPEQLSLTPDHHLAIGGLDTVELAKEYGTPLFVYDIATVRKNIRAFKEAFDANQVAYNIAYASKAFSCLAIYEIINQEEIAIDVVSGGELYTAIQADVPAKNIHFHGNNKSQDELELALEYGVSYFIVDNFNEIVLLNQLAVDYDATVFVQIRIAPGFSAHTHDFIKTGQRDSKFGFDLENGQAYEAIKLLLSMDKVRLDGVHCHIGSQIFESEAFARAAEKLMDFLADIYQKTGFIAKILNLGGGFGIKYIDQDQVSSIKAHIDTICRRTKEVADRHQYPLPEIWVEPGRSIVGDAALTLYTIGSKKTIPGIRNYVAVDGGMTDNIRPALYQAKYQGLLANKADEKKQELYSIAGKCCESGDMLIWNLQLPYVETNDLLAVFSTGAYGYSMASNYNRLPRPAVIFIEDEQAKLAIRRETYQDLIALDCR